MTLHQYSDPTADIVLIQPVGDHDMPEIENEVAEIKKLTSADFHLIAVKVDDWNSELSPWDAPAVFGNEGFGSGAADTLAEILKLCTDKSKTYYIGGYSLAGLFALWAAFHTDVFSGVAAASPSVWFPDFVGYIKEKWIKCDTVYLSLGDKEERTKNTVMSKVGDCIREIHSQLAGKGTDCVLEWNKGGHFKEPALRTAKAFAWVMSKDNG
ncbi:alpha/beta hydrolase-fold protein [Ruminococcus sp.]|uniref:alpha/beta hydrolase-fold protein n=1 Tax=Ruminococcus sp. TaxID=41978 RepID=UPI0025D79FF3|nr:alpha/beta hydrolase-fold protein [Ruminococcus sp.]